MPPEPPRTRLPRPKGDLLCRGVAFFPQGARAPILAGLGLHLPAGTSLGIRGPIGSGKSSLLRLLVGLGRPTIGEIRLDGVEIWNWSRDDVGRHIGYLPQDISIVPGTVGENIGRFGLFGEEAIAAAARLAGVDAIVEALPNGYDTPVGEGGHPLSGGQRQLVGLARAIVGGPAFVVLDEPNANLDAAGEAALTACLASLRAQGSTIVLVSHRPAVLALLDRTAELVDGRLHFAADRAAPLPMLALAPRDGG